MLRTYEDIRGSSAAFITEMHDSGLALISIRLQQHESRLCFMGNLAGEASTLKFMRKDVNWKEPRS